MKRLMFLLAALAACSKEPAPVTVIVIIVPAYDRVPEAARPPRPASATTRYRSLEVIAAERQHCKEFDKAVWFEDTCDLSRANKKKAAGDRLAFCHLETDRGTARDVHRFFDCEIEARIMKTRAVAYTLSAGRRTYY